MALKWFVTKQEGAILPQGRQTPPVYFRFIDGFGGAGAFYVTDQGGAARPYQIGQVPIGDGFVSYKTSGLVNSQSGLPIKVWNEGFNLDFLSISKTPQKAQDFPTLIRTNRKHILHTAALAASFGTVTYVSKGFGSYLMATGPSSLLDYSGGTITAGINSLSVDSFEKAPAQGFYDETNGEFAPLTNLYAYPEGSKVTPLYGILLKDTYYLIERYDDTSIPVYRISTFVVSKSKYTQGPVLSVTPLGLNYCESEDPTFLILLGFSTAGAYDNLYKLDPTTGSTYLLAPVAVNDPLSPFKRQGLFFLGRDPSSSLDQFVVLDTTYLGLIPEVESASNGDWVVRKSLASPKNYYAITAEREATVRTGPAVPSQADIPTVIAGDPFPVGYPRFLFPSQQVSKRDFPTSITKWIPYYGPFTSQTFNAWMNILTGRNGRIRGMSVIPNGTNTQVAIEVGDNGGAVICNGIGIFFPSDTVLDPVEITGEPPYALTVYTANETSGAEIVFAIETYLPEALSSKAIMAYTDSSGFNWTATLALGLQELAEAASTKQFTSEEEALLISRDGPIDVADTLHRHRVPIPKEVFEAIFNYNYDQVPHTPKATPPVSADDYHGHSNLLTDFEIECLTARGGITSADNQHSHNTLPTSAGFSAVFGGSTSDASAFHHHPIKGHGVIANPSATLFYIRQNIGTGQALIDATESTFTGSLSLILGESTQGNGIDVVSGIKYKENASFIYSPLTSSIGGGQAGETAEEVTETFDIDNPSGILAGVPFGTTFTWRGLSITVAIPSVGGTPFALPSTNRPRGDFFTYNGVVAATEDRAGTPAGFTLMQEGFVSWAAPRWSVVLDERYPGGAFLTMTLA